MTLKEELNRILHDSESHSQELEELLRFIERREEAERERVKAAIYPKVKMLPAGSYARMSASGAMSYQYSASDFVPTDGYEYRRFKNPFDEDAPNA